MQPGGVMGLNESLGVQRIIQGFIERIRICVRMKETEIHDGKRWLARLDVEIAEDCGFGQNNERSNDTSWEVQQAEITAAERELATLERLLGRLEEIACAFQPS